MKKIKHLLLCHVFALSVICLFGQQVELFPLKDVHLLESPFSEAQHTDLKYILALDADRLLAPFCKDAGIPTKAKNYPNWESSGLDGHTAGHYLSALATMYASTGDKEILRRSKYMVSVLSKCQHANGNGYVGGVPKAKQMWKDVALGKFSGNDSSFNKQWVPWYNLHKLFAGLRDVYLFTDNIEAKNTLVKLCDWSYRLVASLSAGQIQGMLEMEYGGMNEVFADVFQMTGNPKYIELAKKFSHKKILDPLLQDKDQLNGLHANTQIPKIIGFERISELDGDKTWHDAADFFWNTVVNNRTVAFGGNSVEEHFNPSANFTSMLENRQGPETCNSYNMLKLSKMLYTYKNDLKYLDYYERTMYNHILSSQHPSNGGFVYFTPIRPQHYRVYSQPQESFWCCVGTGMENHSKYGELIYAHTKNELFVNFFIASQLVWKEKGLSIVQQTNFPESDVSTLKITSVKATEFPINIRYPSWVKPKSLRILINGHEEKFDAAPDSYVTINRKWKTGDVVTIHLPMHVTTEYLPDGSPWVAFLYGPILLAAKTDTSNMDGLFAGNSRNGHIASGKLYPLDIAPMIVSPDKDFAGQLKPVLGKKLTFNASTLVYPSKYSNLELIPFYKLHDARYMMYWQTTTPNGLDSIKQTIHKREQEKLKLDEATIDRVMPGEQQPESDHNMLSDQSSKGINRDRHWRDAHNYFSYELKDLNNEAVSVQVTYWGADKGRIFDVSINNTIIKTENLKGEKGNNFFIVDYLIPINQLQNAAGSVFTIKFTAQQGSNTAGVYDVRLMKKYAN